MTSESREELERLNRYYSDYHIKGQWSRETPGNRAIHEERTRALRHLVGTLPKPLGECTILDVGCGTGSQLGLLASWGARSEHLSGVDLMEDRIKVARSQFPHIRFEVGNAETLPFGSAEFDVAATFTMFSSILDDGMARHVASEISRVLRPGGCVLWYELRVGNPRNANIRGVGRAQISRLFPGYEQAIRSITLVPPLARRLGPATKILYPVLAAVPFLRTHYLGLLKKPLA